MKVTLLAWLDQGGVILVAKTRAGKETVESGTYMFQ